LKSEWDKLSDAQKHEYLWRTWDKGEVDPFSLNTCYPDFMKKLRTLSTSNHEKLEAIKVLNTALYEALPSGDVDAFELIKLIGSHYEQVAEVLGE